MAAKKPKKRVKKRVGKGLTRTRRRITKKGVVKKRLKQKSVAKKPKEKIIGIVTHYFPQVRAAAIKLKAPLSLGDTVRIKGHTTDFTQGVNSLQIDRVPITKAKRGQEIGLLVNSRVRHKDAVYKA